MDYSQFIQKFVKDNPEDYKRRQQEIEKKQKEEAIKKELEKLEDKPEVKKDE